MPSTTQQDPWPLPELTRARRAIVVVDVVESVRLMQEDEAGFIERWRRFVHEVRNEVLPKHGGRMVKSLGDGMLLEFEAAPVAARVCFELLQRLRNQSKNAPAGQDIELKVGVNVDELVVDDIDIYGTGVNLAARLADLATTGQVLATASVLDALTDGIHARAVDMGERYLKHFNAPVRTYRLLPLDAVPEATVRIGRSNDLRPRIAVIPFQPSGDEQARFVGDAIADGVIAALSRRQAMKVVSRLSTRALSGNDGAIEAARKHLGADYLVNGRFYARGASADVWADVVRTRDGSVLWSTQSIVGVESLLHGEDGFVATLVENLSRVVVNTELTLARQLPFSSLAGYSLWVASVALLHRLSRGDFELSRQMLEHLADRYPRNPAPHTMLAKWHILRSLQGWTDNPTQEGRLGSDRARRALDFDPDDALALSLEAILKAHFGGDLDDALSLCQLAARNNPQEPNAWLAMSGISGYLGRGEDSERYAAQSVDLSPVDPARFLFDVFLAAGKLANGRFDDAAFWARSSIRRNSMHPASHRILTIACAMLGEVDQARAAGQALLRLDPAFTVAGYAKRYPGREAAHASTYLAALLAAGLPA